jgi:glycosyltransferase involved in cell wall biosynthesis
MKTYLSVVIPAFNEAENLVPLYREIQTVTKKIYAEFEIIFVNDGSSDNTQKIIENLNLKDPEHVRGLQMQTHYGKAAALQAGFKNARGEMVIQLDADLQDDPKEIPKFLKKMDEGFDLAVGWKQQRKDSFIKNQTSKIFNAVTNTVSGVRLHDHNCGFKAYRKDILNNLNLYGDMHRYIPMIVQNLGYKIGEVPINHRRRRHGKSKYGLTRFIYGYLDLMTAILVTRFRTRPLHYFGYMGLFLFLIGAGLVIIMAVFILKGQMVLSDLLLFLLAAIIFVTAGIQILAAGLIGELILNYSQKENYVIKKII